MEKNFYFREISSENNQFQLFELDSKKLREIFDDHGEQLIKWKNNNCSQNIIKEINSMD